MTSETSNNINKNNENSTDKTKKYLANFFSRDLFLNNLKRNKIFMIVIGVVLTCSAPLIGWIAYINNSSMDKYGASILATIIIIVAMAFALILGLHIMGYTHNKTSAIFYNSLPIKKTCLFSTQFISGIIYFLIPLAVIYIPTIILFIGDGEAARTVTEGFIWGAMLFLLTYSFNVLAANISGTMFNSFLLFCYLNSYAISLLGIISLYINGFYPFTSTNMLMSYEVVTKTSPLIYFPVKIFEKWAEHSLGEFIFILLGILVFSVAFYAASMYLNKINKTENAGKSINFKLFERIFKYSMLTIMSLVGGILFISMNDSMGTPNYFMFFFGIIIFSFITFMLMNFIIRRNIRETFKGIKNYCIFAIIVCIALPLFTIDVFRFDKYLPNVNSVDSITFDYLDTSVYYASGHELNYLSLIVDNPTTIAIINDIFKSAMKADGTAWYFEDESLTYLNNNNGLRNYNSDIIFKRRNGFDIKKKLPNYLTFKNQQDYDEYSALVDKLYTDESWKKAVFAPIFDDSYLESLLNPNKMNVHIQLEIYNTRVTEEYYENVYGSNNISNYAQSGSVLVYKSIDIKTLSEIFENARKDILTFDKYDIMSNRTYSYSIAITISYSSENDVYQHYTNYQQQFYLGVDKVNGKYNFDNLMKYFENNLGFRE